MVKKPVEQFVVIKKNDMPKFIIAILIFVSSVYFIFTQFGFIKSKPTSTALDVVAPPIAAPSTGFDKETLSLIIPCDNAGVNKPVPGVNCMIPYYNPGADPIAAPEGRQNPFVNF